MRLLRIAATLVVTWSILSVLGTPATAQSGRNGERPPGWQIRYDGEAAEEARPLEVMRPGWHIFAGPGAVIWDPSRHAAGDYGVTSKIFLFGEDVGGSSSRSLGAPFGIIVGGQDLAGESASYVAFVIRADRSFAVVRRSGGAVDELVPWTEHEAVATLQPGEATAENNLAVDATSDAVTFWINDQQVAELPRARLALEGTVGLRAGADLSLHVTEILIGPNRR